MAITPLAPAPPRPSQSNGLLLRVIEDFDEMPALRLTTRQAMRLWGLDRPMCEALLQTLVEDGFLVRDSRGQFAKRRAGYCPCS